MRQQVNWRMHNLVTLLISVSVFHIKFSNAVVADPSCQPNQPGVCWAVGDPHVRNFAGQINLFSTTGKVLLVSDRKSLWVRMKLRNTGRASQIVNLYIDLINNGKRTNIVFNADFGDTENIYRINYKQRPIPYQKFGVTITPVQYGVHIDSEDIHIKWLNKARVFITLGKKYQGTVDGECGTYCGKPAGKGYSSSSRNKVRVGLRLDKPYNEDYSNIDSIAFGQLATEIEISVRKLFDPTFIGVKVTGAKSGSTIVSMDITMAPDGEKFNSSSMSEDIKNKIVKGKNDDGEGLGDLLHEKILSCDVSEPEVVMDESDFDVEPEISAADEENDEEIDEQRLQAQGSPYFGQSQNQPEPNDHKSHKDSFIMSHHAPHHESSGANILKPTDCVSKGKEYKDGETIEESYGNCTCREGKWECKNGFGICALWGNDNMETFDEHYIKVDKECNYLLLSDCKHPSKFSISTEETFKCTENIKEKKRVLVLTVGKDNHMRIGNKEIMYNGKQVHPPKTIRVGGSSGVITITEDERKVKISLNKDDLMIEWNRKLYYGITLRQRDSCGLCGNFNGNASDDSKQLQHVSGCRAKHPGCHNKDAGFDHPKQLYNVSCDDIEKLEFPVYHGEGCKKIKADLLRQCLSCVVDIPNVCLHSSNTVCIKHKEKTCVSDLFAHFLRTCYSQVFTGQSATARGSRKKRDVRAIQLSHAIGSVDIYKMSIDDINKALKNPEILN